MIIKKLYLTNFKNHQERVFDFSSEINSFVGNNGAGKTNILDALHYLSVGKSFLGNSDVNNIFMGEDFFTLEAVVDDGEKETILKIIQSKDSKKLVKKNDKSYARLSDHIGFLPSVMISPYDANLISDSGESRRRFLDAMISQVDAEYLHSIMQYQKALKQRNALLKSFAKNRYFDKDSLEIYDEPLCQYAGVIFEKRNLFITQLLPTFLHFYNMISNGKEEVNIVYQSDLEEQTMAEVLSQNVEKDRVLTYTSKGIHKDELRFEMSGDLIKKIGSQGQQKSFLIALKLAQINRIKEITGKTPLLLLDDIFDKLDDRRVAQLIELVNKEHFGQIFITDTHKERTEAVVKNINEESRIFEIT
ncbi:DNA replication/repair protein RecF [Riemerella anatipestifer]|uniref:DNA replication/repair protein RecF n=1 Tax=Riemerella anatipestifer TaxID=34085 RepID=UPI0021D5D73B|nr:DNA replication/repair protein RecF [Riemerella anatipestifer]MCU7580023.1 DNA replication/repair protein RecF [Riemerella anatipestifer]